MILCLQAQEGDWKNDITCDNQATLNDAATNQTTDPAEQLTERHGNVQSALFVAAKDGDVAVVKQLVERGAYINKRDCNSRTPLFVAAEHGHDNLVEWLVENGADTNKADLDGLTPVQAAARNRHSSTVELLIKLHTGEKMSVLWQLAQVGYYEAAKMLKTLTEDDIPLLFAASAAGALQKIEELVKHVGNFNETNPRGLKPLHAAARSSAEAAVYPFGLHSAEIEKGQILRLIAAAHVCHQQIVKLLLSRGVDGSRRNSDAVSPQSIDPDDQTKNPGGRRPSLGADAKFGHLASVKLLLEYGEDMNAHDGAGNSPLTDAIKQEHSEVVATLLKLGGDDTLRSRDLTDGMTALMMAVGRNNYYIARLLCDKKTSVNLQDSRGMTALMYATQECNFSLVEMLLESGAKVNLQDNQGRTALHCAVKDALDKFRDDQLHALDLLLKHGADI